jgi:hypothetical protein
MSLLSHRVEISSSLLLTDINIHAESFYKDLLNLIYGYELKNLNEFSINMDAIDLGDRCSRIAVQVTSKVTLEKVRSTIDKFVKKKLFAEYDRLIFVSLTKKKLFRKNIEISGEFTFDSKNDILDYIDIAKKVGYKPVSEIRKILIFLDDEFEHKRRDTPPINGFESDVNEILISGIFHNLESPDMEIYAWHQISNIFYRNIALSNKIFESIFYEPSRFEIDINSLSVAHYFYTRLLFKLGDSFKAKKHAEFALKLSSKATEPISKRISLLTNARLAIETNSINLTHKRDNLYILLEMLTNLNVKDCYIVSEKSSLLGRLIELMYSENIFHTANDKKIIEDWSEEHSQLLKHNTMSFGKHSLVSIFIQIISTLWNDHIRGDKKIEILYRLINEGEDECKRQKNSIFYIQLLFTKAITYFLENKKRKTHELLKLIGELLKLKHIALEHEGVKQFINYLKYKMPKEANLVYAFYRRIGSHTESCIISHEWLKYINGVNTELYRIPICEFE